jgi:hypothetical protein
LRIDRKNPGGFPPGPPFTLRGLKKKTSKKILHTFFLLRRYVADFEKKLLRTFLAGSEKSTYLFGTLTVGPFSLY